MDFLVIVNSIINFFKANLPIAIAAAILLVFFIFRKPKLFFIVFFIAVLLLGGLYLISTISYSGVSYKEKLLHKQDLP